MKAIKIILKILGIVLLVLVVLGGVGYLFRDSILPILMAKMPGNLEQYHVENVSEDSDSPLRGMNFIFLGSSVTEGSGALDVSFVDYMEKIDGITVIKEAVSGTTLVTEGDSDGSSYIPRMKTIDPAFPADCFVCQLSTNDASQKKALGTVSESFDMADFDTDTIAGAIETVIAYAQETWHCPVVFYTGTRYDSAEYGQMVELLHEIQDKWGIGVIDMWNDPDMNAVSAEDYKLYMANEIHPTQAGYLLWWTPFMESYLYDFLK